MSNSIGKQAVVIGAGIAGLVAARVLADYFDRVLVLERDMLPGVPDHRPGTPQSRHTHTLLSGGMQALRGLFPELERQLIESGSIILDVGLDLRSERPDYNPFPQRKTDVVSYSASRPLIEHCLQKSTRQQSNIAFNGGQRVVSLATTADGKAVTGVRSEAAGQGIHTVAADLVVDASGRGALTLDLLKSLGYAAPLETAIGMDMGYTSIRFAVPDDAPAGWKAVSTGANPPHSSRAAWLWPIEGRQWLLTLLGMRGQKPPGDWGAAQDFLRSLRTRTIHDAVSRAERVDGIHRFALPSSVMRHFERLQAFPRRLLPIGDAICRFNPFFGQGITVAALEALHLQRLLRERVGESDSMADLAAPYFAGVQDLLTEPWSTALLDLVYPDIVGDRPANFGATLKYGASVRRLAANDSQLHKLLLEVQHMLKPSSALRSPEIEQRVLALMDE